MANRLSEYIDFFQALHKTFVQEHSFECSSSLSEIVKLPRLMVVLNHATPLSWLPAMTTMGIEFNKAGGGHRYPRGIVDKWFYSNPLTKPLAEYLSQSDRPLNFEELIKQFKASEDVVLVISPEGANTFFGDVHQVQDFRSHRYIELAVRTSSPILIIAHKGSEGWSIPIQVPPEITNFVANFSSFFGARLQQFGRFNLPLPPHKIDLFKMKAELYQPSLTDLFMSNDLETRKLQIQAESLKVKEKLESLLSSL